MNQSPVKKYPNPQWGYESLFDLRNPAPIQEAILLFGVEVEYRKAQRCPCSKKYRSEPAFWCELCNGYGWVWDEPVKDTKGKNVRALISNRVSQKQWSPEGAWETGMCYATFPVGIVPTTLDKIVIVADSVAVNDEILTFGGKFPDGKSSEVLRYRSGIKAEKIVTLKGEFLPTTGFTLDGNRIQWVDSGTLKEGDQYSIRYQANPEYLIMREVPHLRADGLFEKPFFAQLMRLDLALPSKSEE